MFKKFIIGGFVGGVIGVIVNFSILSLAVHMGWKDKYSALCLPELAEWIQNDIFAVIIQAVFCFMLGFIIGGIADICSAKRSISL